ncbi:hypothetical protein I350_03692 [Cryptococcus amylolentus CBS 6273]|uniref:Vacuolar protein-sorting-associated protein 36 n=1 Tax=Cryptococcus amylolentus CBS 6273 TaxID=1296118 RepID=A0A1E3K4H4_9TREE|nr:hypothetical protein I350_03692 [Cryptococcus amylolentus CBS 6273]
MPLPPDLSPVYWSAWTPVRPGASVLESVHRDQGEEWIGSWDNVGLYEGNNKVPSHQLLTLHLTNQRIITIPSYDNAASVLPPSLQTHLSHVRQTEYYAGFMRSSAKITLTLGIPAQNPATSTDENDANSWSCRVCGFANESNGIAKASKCGLCGVPYAQAIASTEPSRAGSPSSSGPLPLEPHIKEDKDTVACPACTFLNSSLLPNCEICTTPLPRALPSSTPRAKNAEKDQIIRFSFRKGGDKDAYNKLKSILGDKAWERASGAGNVGTPLGPDGERSGAGIYGILQSIDLNAKAQDSHMQHAFADLEALMLRAGEMVKLAQSLNQKLSAQQSGNGSGATEEEATMIRTTLVQLGLEAPALTKEMAKTKLDYHEGLARELGGLLTGRGESGLMVGEKGRGVIGLDEVWGLWMRARGVALLPPQTLVDVLPHLPSNTNPSITSLSLPSTLHVLHTPSFSTSSILLRTLERLNPAPEDAEGAGSEEKSFSLIEFASQESLPIGLAQEFVELMESEGGLARDDQAGQGDGGVRWYRDIMASQTA